VRKGVDRTETIKKFLQVNYGIDASDPLAALPSTGYAAPGTFRGNSPTLKDNYLFGMIHINYMLPAQIKCPPLK
jgi:hypothetical protein